MVGGLWKRPKASKPAAGRDRLCPSPPLTFNDRVMNPSKKSTALSAALMVVLAAAPVLPRQAAAQIPPTQPAADRVFLFAYLRAAD